MTSLADRRVFASLLALVFLLFLMESARVSFQDSTVFTSCRLDARGAISYLAALHPSCPMFPYERVSGVRRGDRIVPVGGRGQIAASDPYPRVEVQVERGAERRRVPLELRRLGHPMRSLEFTFVLGSALLAYALALLALRHLPVESGRCAAALFTSLGIGFGSDLQSIHSSLLEFMDGLAQMLAPATASHLLLVYPRPVRLVRDLPLFQVVPYAIALGLAELADLLAVRESRLWEVPERLLGVWLVLTSGLLALRCSARVNFGARRGRILRGGVLFAAGTAVFLSLLVLVTREDRPPDSLRAVFSFLVLGLGVVSFRSACRLRGEDLKPTNWGMEQLVQSGVVLVVLLLVVSSLPVGHPAVLGKADAFWVALGVLCLVLWFEQCRSASWWLVGRVVEPGAPRFQEIQREHRRLLEEACDEDGLVRALAIGCSRALDCGEVTAFLRMGDAKWRLAYRQGEPDCARAEACFAESTLARQEETVSAPRVLLLSWLPDEFSERRATLRAAGVDLLVGLHSARGEMRGLLLGTHLRRIFDVNSETCRFLELLAAHTSHALERWDFEQELVTHARMAAVGHAASGLAHDLGRPLGEIYLEACQTPPSASSRSVKRCAVECLDLLEAFVHDARASHEGIARLDSVIQAALDRITHLKASRRALVRLSPAPPCVPDPRSVQRIFENLLENAFQWNPHEELVEVTATEHEGRALVRIIDRGPGMSRQQSREAFGRFRSGRNGAGLGLAICRDIAEKLGGSVSLESGLGGGTVATVNLPIVESASANG